MGILKDYSPRTIPGVVQRRQVTLTSAQILALFSTPVALVPAPGAGKYISVDEIVGKVYSTGKVAYTGANAVEIRYTNGAGVKATGDLAAAWLNAAADQADKAVGVAVSTMVANAALVVAVPTANPGAGTGTVTFDVLYRVLTV